MARQDAKEPHKPSRSKTSHLKTSREACKSASTREGGHNPPTRDAEHIILQGTATFRYLSATVQSLKSKYFVKDILPKLPYNTRPKNTDALTPKMAGPLNSGPRRNSQPQNKRTKSMHDGLICLQHTRLRQKLCGSGHHVPNKHSRLYIQASQDLKNRLFVTEVLQKHVNAKSAHEIARIFKNTSTPMARQDSKEPHKPSQSKTSHLKTSRDARKSASTREGGHNPPTRDAGHIILQGTATFR